MRRFVVISGSFIASQLVAPGSVITEVDLTGPTGVMAEPGSALVEIDSTGRPIEPSDIAKLRASGVNFGPVEVAPIMPHAPNPTRPQAIAGHEPGAAAIAGDREFVPAVGVENNEAAAARVERLTRELAEAQAAAEAVAKAEADAASGEPIKPTRRSSAPAETVPGPLDGSVADLEKSLANVNDVAQLEALHKAETDGKARTTALAAIDARIDQLKTS